MPPPFTLLAGARSKVVKYGDLAYIGGLSPYDTSRKAAKSYDLQAAQVRGQRSGQPEGGVGSLKT
jgi:hypothetical protein